MASWNPRKSAQVIALFDTATTEAAYWQAERAADFRMSDLSPKAMRVLGQAFYRCISPNGGATTHATPALIAITEQRNPTEAEASALRTVIEDGAGTYPTLSLSRAVATVLTERDLLLFCGDCTGHTIRDCFHDEDGGYTAAVYHVVNGHTYACLIATGQEIADITAAAEQANDDSAICADCRRRQAVAS